jgi:hypothetical protein
MACLQRNNSFDRALLFPEKRSKKRCSASRKTMVCLQRNNSLNRALLFPEKEAKSVVPLRGRRWLASKETIRSIGLFFFQKRGKKRCSASQKTMACLQRNNSLNRAQKALFRFAEDNDLSPKKQFPQQSSSFSR